MCLVTEVAVEIPMSLIAVSLVVGGAAAVVFGLGFWLVRLFARRFEKGRD
jgi:ABC-type transporter Mla subunit MlaD